MCRRLSILVVLSVFCVSLARAQWVKLDQSYSGINFCFTTIGSNVFAGGNGVYRSTDSGISWTTLNMSGSVGTVYALATMGTDLFAGTSSAGIKRSTDNGASWTPANTGFPNHPVPRIRALTSIGTTFFAGTDRGIFFSTDNGEDWAEVSDTLTREYISTLTVRGTDIFAGGQFGDVFISSNNGTSWRHVNTGSRHDVYAISASSTSLFAASYGDGVLQSKDNGATWSTISTGLTPPQVYALGVTDSILFAGTTGGVFLSKDNGKSWTATGMGGNVVDYALAMFGSYVFAGTDSYVYRRSISELISDHTVLRIQPDDSIWFGNVTIGADSVRSVTISDTGSAPVTIGSFQLTFGQTDFVTSDLSSAVTLHPGESMTFQALFHPSTSGYHIAIVTILSEGHRVDIKLTGMGVDNAGVRSDAPKQPISIYPNPTASSSTITFTPESSGHADVRVVNMLGAEIARIFSGELDASQHTFTWDTGKMPVPRGMYEVVVRMNGKTQAVPVVVQ